MVEIIKQSELPKTRPLERFRRNNVDSAPKFAHVTRMSNGQYVTFWQDNRVVIDVILWSITEKGAKEAGAAIQKFYDRSGYPKGRTAIIVKLGE